MQQCFARELFPPAERSFYAVLYTVFERPSWPPPCSPFLSRLRACSSDHLIDQARRRTTRSAARSARADGSRARRRCASMIISGLVSAANSPAAFPRSTSAMNGFPAWQACVARRVPASKAGSLWPSAIRSASTRPNGTGERPDDAAHLAADVLLRTARHHRQFRVARHALVEHGQDQGGLGWPPLVERRLAYLGALGHRFHRQVAGRRFFQQRADRIHDGGVRGGGLAAGPSPRGRSRFGAEAFIYYLTERTGKSI